MQPTLFFLTLAVLSVAPSYDNETNLEFHQRQDRLISQLFSGYRKDVPPISTRDRYSTVNIEPIVVNITLAYAKLLSVDELHQCVNMIVEYYMYWNDARLTWNPLDFDSIEGFWINIEQVWKVDVMPWDSSSVVDVREPDVRYAYVSSNGIIDFYVASIVSFLCPLDIKKFPFDKQVCNINFVSYNFDSKELQINGDILENYDKSTASNGEWTVDELTSKAISSIDGDSSYEFYMAIFTFHFRRSSTYYVSLIIIPSSALTFLCVLGLFWSRFDDREYLDKIGLGFAAILAMCTILQIVEASVPKTTQLPLLSIYIMVNLLLVTVAISVVVIASRSCSSPKADTPNVASKKSLCRFSSILCAQTRLICLVIFSLAAGVNLLLLVSNA